MQTFMKNHSSESDTHDLTQTVQPADLPNVQENKLSDTQLRRSHTGKQPKETLTHETLGQPTGLHTNPLYVNTPAPAPATSTDVRNPYGLSYSAKTETV